MRGEKVMYKMGFETLQAIIDRQKSIFLFWGIEERTKEMTTDLLQNWLRQKLSEEISVDTNEINLDGDFANLDLDSLSVVSLAYELETFTGVIIDPTVFSEFRTPNELIQWIQLQKK
jgi:acyl carrier protein